MQREARAVIEMLDRERRIGIVMPGRPYHHDPGLSHGILDGLQKRGTRTWSHNAARGVIISPVFGPSGARGIRPRAVR
jgi:predicted nucleotide-binding protein (sugar kinase/HSP70/actin superfamily)